MTLTEPTFQLLLPPDLRSRLCDRIRLCGFVKYLRHAETGFGIRKWSGNGMGEPRHAIIFAMHLLYVHLLVDK
jgi:hypothetical protein